MATMAAEQGANGLSESHTNLLGLLAGDARSPGLHQPTAFSLEVTEDRVCIQVWFETERSKELRALQQTRET